MHAESSSIAASANSPLLKRYRAYFTPHQVNALQVRQRGKLSTSRHERNRQVACSFIDRVGVRIGFPRRVIATAQTLHHRFHLFFPVKDFNYQEIALTTLYVSSKLHDTLKKPRDIILASYAIRFPDLLKGRVAVDPATVDQKMLENDRRKVLSIERLVLETICFNFRLGDRSAFACVVKLAKALKLSKEFTHSAWRVTADVYRTLSPLQYPPQSLCLAAIYVSALLLRTSDAMNDSQLADENPNDLEDDMLIEARKMQSLLGQGGWWEDTFVATASQIQSIAHDLLDTYIVAGTHPIGDPSTSLISSPMSPSEKPLDSVAGLSNPGNLAALLQASTNFVPPPFWNPQTLTQLKIALRELAPAATVAMNDSSIAGRSVLMSTGMTVNEILGDVAEGLGKKDSTVRFLAA